MAGFEAKAKAIWSALDEMAEKNPDMYKQFINDQLSGDGAQEMMKQLNLGSEFVTSASGINRKTPGSKIKKTLTESESVDNSSMPNSSKTRSVLTASSGRMSGVDKKESEPKASNSLLDDTFVQSNSNLLINPSLAQIVANDEDYQCLFTELKLPQEEGNGDDKKTKQRRKVLIEEL